MFLVLALAALAFLPPPTLAEAPAELASFAAHGDRLEWSPRVEARHGCRVTLSGPGVDVSRTFKGGERPALSLFVRDGQPLPDGTYVWEITLAGEPREAAGDPYNGRDARPTKAAARRPDGRRLTQGGSFTVLDGRVLDTSLRETPEVKSEADSR